MVNRSLLYGGLSSLALVLVACPPPPTPPVIASVTTTPNTAQTLAVGATLPVTATVNRVAGNTTAAQTVTWSSSNTAVATVAPATGSAPNNAATVTAVAAGTTTIRAQSTVDASKFATFQLTVTAASATVTAPVRRRNAGGPLVTATPVNWLADAENAAGQPQNLWTCSIPAGNPTGLPDPGTATPAIVIPTGTQNPAPLEIYQSNHYCPAANGNLVYSSTAAAAGDYTVRLHFAETFVTAAGARVFNVKVNTGAVSPNIDVFAEAGGQRRALVKDFPAGTLAENAPIVITFTPVNGDAFVSGIEFVRTGPPIP